MWIIHVWQVVFGAGCVMDNIPQVNLIVQELITFMHNAWNSFVLDCLDVSRGSYENSQSKQLAS